MHDPTSSSSEPLFSPPHLNASEAGKTLWILTESLQQIDEAVRLVPVDHSEKSTPQADAVENLLSNLIKRMLGKVEFDENGNNFFEFPFFGWKHSGNCIGNAKRNARWLADQFETAVKGFY